MIVDLMIGADHYGIGFFPFFPVLWDMEAERRGMCHNCSWSYFPHPLVGERMTLPDGTRLNKGHKLCTLHFRKYYMPQLSKGDGLLSLAKRKRLQ